MKKLLLVAALLGASAALWAQEPDLGSEAQREAGKKIYMQKCAQCHGVKGEGDGVAQAYFRPAPRDLTAAAYKIRTTESGELPTDADLRKVIREGMPYTGMPAWPDFSDEELENLVYFIKTFAEDFADPDYLVPPLDMPQAPPYSAESVARGRVVYEENKCIDCHGLHGRSDGESAPTLKDDWDQPVRAADLTKRWTFRGGATRGDIYRTFTTGLNGTPMPSYADLLEEEDRWHLVDYVYSLSRDQPEYAAIVVAKGMAAALDIAAGKALFDGAQRALFPLAGQVIEPGRAFYPSANAIEVSAVYSAEHIAIMLVWNDMAAEKAGRNGPDIQVPVFDPEAEASEETFSDAVALQLPAEASGGTVRPYFLFGDPKNPVDIWFVDLAGAGATRFAGRGSQLVAPVDAGGLTAVSSYAAGEWTVIFVQERHPEQGVDFAEGDFVPIALAVWDGFNEERGNKCAISSWYNMYLEPMETASVAVPMAQYGLMTFLGEILLVYWVRRKYNHNKQHNTTGG